MGEPFTFKDMETTTDMARGLIQYIENSIVDLSDEIFNAIRAIRQGENSNLSYSYGEWDRFVTAYIHDDEVINDFNRLITIANYNDIDLNKDIFFLQKFLRYLRPQYEKKKRPMAQIVNLGGMGNLKRFLKKAEDIIRHFGDSQFPDIYKTGRTNAITGNKGGGKTHLAVWHMRKLREQGFKIYTNIIFKRCTKVYEKNGQIIREFEEDYPEGIEKVDSLVGLLKAVAMGLKKNPYQRSVFFWDEIQNSLNAYDWNTQLFKALQRFLSITRKFGQDDPSKKTAGGICVTVMTPSFERGMPKGIREELDFGFLKDEELYEKFIQDYPDGKQYSLKKIVFSKKGRRSIMNMNSIGVPYEVGTCDLCDEANVKEGEYVYAQKGFSFLSFGSFDSGKEMDMNAFKDFLMYTSKALPEDLPDAVIEYLKGDLHKCEAPGCDKMTTNPKYCSDACKQRAYRQRSNGKRHRK